MKIKTSIKIFLALIVLSFCYRYFITTIYAYIQGQSICKWLNTGEGDFPAVGPGAFEHLLWLKDSSTGNYDYEVVVTQTDPLIRQVSKRS